MYKTIIIFTLVIVGVIGLMWWGSSAQQSIGTYNGVKSVLSASEEIYDFGEISMKDGDVTKDFIAANPGSEDVFITTLATSCMCTKAFIIEQGGTTKGPFGMPGMSFVPPVNSTIKAGENFTIRAVYDPNAHGPAGVGRINRFITLTDKSGGQLQFEIKALVTP